MLKKYLFSSFIFLFAVSLSGCSILNTTTSKSVGGVLKSENSGMDWKFKNKVDEKKNISEIEVLQMAIDPIDTNRIYLGTKKKGIVFSTDGAETWKKMKFPANDVYGIGINRFRSGTIYATGVYGKRGKVFESEDYGKNWKEIYTEPADGTRVTALMISYNEPNVLYIGTSEGAIFKTVDSGKTWRKIYTTKGVISQILFGDSAGKIVYFVTYKKDLIITRDSGNSFEIAGKKQTDMILKNGLSFSIAVDNDEDGSNLYLGTSNGLFKSSDQGKSFKQLDILSDSSKFAIRSIAINPKNPQEIIYGAAQAIYKSVDSGKHWATFQIDTDKVLGNISFDPNDVSVIYAGLRSFSK
ncbi:MAG TPA: hypothetical protein ENJ27_02220 [Candidatus Moranbacteria bacterium]|nr:hypothetical protein [Candidatus Moranbacteria bacterium]